MAEVHEELRQWDWHPNAIRSLIVHTALQAVKDASTLAHDRLVDDANFRREQVPKLKESLERWVYDERFDFWVECVNVDSNSARTALLDILDGNRQVALMAYKDREQEALKMLESGMSKSAVRKHFSMAWATVDRIWKRRFGNR